MIAAAAEAADDLTILTFNHDLVIENEIAKRARLSGRWCLDEGYGSFSGSLTPVNTSGSTPRFNLHGDGVCNHARPIRVLKLHGSLNWMVRLNSAQPTSRTLSGEGSTAIQLLTQKLAPGRPVFNLQGGRGRSRWPLWPVVIPPVYAKQALRRRLQLVWGDAQTELGRADRVVFFGYSLPVIDIDAEKLFERSLAVNSSVRWADIVNPDPAAAERYAGLSPAIPIRWYPSFRTFMPSASFPT